MTTKTAPEKVLLAFDQGGILTTSGEIPSKNVWKLYGLSENEAIKVWHLHDEDFLAVESVKINGGIILQKGLLIKFRSIE